MIYHLDKSWTIQSFQSFQCQHFLGGHSSTSYSIIQKNTCQGTSSLQPALWWGQHMSTSGFHRCSIDPASRKGWPLEPGNLSHFGPNHVIPNIKSFDLVFNGNFQCQFWSSIQCEYAVGPQPVPQNEESLRCVVELTKDSVLKKSKHPQVEAVFTSTPWGNWDLGEQISVYTQLDAKSVAVWAYCKTIYDCPFLTLYLYGYLWHSALTLEPETKNLSKPKALWDFWGSLRISEDLWVSEVLTPSDRRRDSIASSWDDTNNRIMGTKTTAIQHP